MRKLWIALALVGALASLGTHAVEAAGSKANAKLYLGQADAELGQTQIVEPRVTIGSVQLDADATVPTLHVRVRLRKAAPNTEYVVLIPQAHQFQPDSVQRANPAQRLTTDAKGHGVVAFSLAPSAEIGPALPATAAVQVWNMPENLQDLTVFLTEDIQLNWR